LRLASF